MYNLVRIRTASTLALLIGAATGCDSSTAVLEGFDPSQASAALESLLIPMDPAEAGRVLLEDALEGLESKGLVIADPAGGLAGVMADRVAPAGGPLGSVTIPDSLLGRTFVYVGDSDSWVVDGTQAGAPTDGIRVIWYAVNGQGDVILPVDSIGYIDLRDRDSGDTTAVDLNMVATPESDAPLAAVRMGQRFHTAGDVDFTEYFEAMGSYANNNATANGFSAGLEYQGSEETGDGSFDISLSLQGAGVSYTVATTGVEAAGLTVEQQFEASVVQGSLEVDLELSISGSGSNETGSGTLSNVGGVIADITLSGGSLSFRSPDGERFSDRTALQLNDLVTAMFLYGYRTFSTLPFILL